MKKSIIVSDVSGKEINGNGVVVTFDFSDGTHFTLDALESEVKSLSKFAHETPKRGRKPKK